MSEIDIKYQDIATANALRTLDIAVHRRKWSLIFSGIDGKAGEDDQITREIIMKFGHEKLDLQDDILAKTTFAACHRLSQSPNAGIVAKFVDLSVRNAWLANAKNLKNKKSKVSITPDLPPIIQELKTNIMNYLKSLPTERKTKAQVRYHPQWPYISLKLPDGSTRVPEQSVTDIVKRFYRLGLPSVKDADPFTDIAK